MNDAAVAHRPQPRLPDWLVQNRNFVLLWAAYGVAAIGDHLSEQALLKVSGGLHRPDVTRVQALMSFGFFLPFVFLGPIAGWWSDRFSRKTTMVAADLLRAGLVFNIAFIVTRLQHWLMPQNLGDFAIVIPLLVIGTLAAFFSPARQAMLPTLIRDDQLVRANALISALGTIGTIISAVVGGWLVDSVGPEWNYHINAGTFLLSALFLGGIAMSRSRQVTGPKLEGVWQPLKQGFRYVRTHRRVLDMILLGTVFWAAAGAVISVVPAIVKVYFGESYTAAGTFRGIMGIGLATGAAVMTILGAALPLQLAVLIPLAAACGWLLLLNLAHTLHLGTVLTGLCLFGIGGAGAALLVTIMATVQRFVPDSRRGRVFGVSDTLTMGAMVAATGALGLPNIPKLDMYIPYILGLTALLFAFTLVIAWRRYRRGSKVAARTWVSVKFVELFSRFWCRAKRIGPCTVPARGPALIAANHTTGIDPIMIIATCPLRLPSFLVAREYYRKPLAKFFCDMNACIPINRENPGKAFLSGALRTLERGGVLGIFPQGRFQVPGEPETEPLAGVGAIALRTGVPVIPVHISGAQYRDNPFASFFVRHNVRVRDGAPIDLSAFKGRERDKDAAREVAELIMQRIQELGRADEATAAQKVVKAAAPLPTQLPPRTLLAAAALVPVIATIVLAALSVPLGKPGTLVYPYSGFDAIRLAKIVLALPPIALLALAVIVAAKERRDSARYAVLLLALGIVWMGVWALTAAPQWQRQNFFNMSSPSHDGAFMLEVEHVRRLGVAEYLRTFASRAATPPAEMKGTRVISNPPAITLIAAACDATVRHNTGLRDTLASLAVDEPGIAIETQERAGSVLLFALVLIGMWALGGLTLYVATRTRAPPHIAVFIAACATVTPMTLLFTPGKDAAQLLTTALPLWLWLLAVKRRNVWLGMASGMAACLACCVSLAHLWIAACVYLASLLSTPDRNGARSVFPVAGAALAGAALAGSVLWWVTGYEIVAASRAVAAAQAAVTRGDNAMPLAWQAVGIPLFMLFCGPALWLMALAVARGTSASPHAAFGRALVLITVIVMVLTVGFTNIETPRLWIPFAALLTLGLPLASRWIDADRNAVARLLAWVVVLQGLVSAYQWSKMDMRETEMRLLESPDGGARLFH